MRDDQMAEVLRIVLNDFWSWLGTFLIVGAAARGLRIRVTTKRKITHDDQANEAA
jgi:hypothetical protein